MNYKEKYEQALERAIYMMEQLNMTKSWDDVYNWLKSLKPHWKPTEEQLQTLKDTINDDAYYTRVDVLESLYNDLKKL